MRNEPTAAVPARGSAGSPVTSARSGLAPRGLRSGIRLAFAPGVRNVENLVLDKASTTVRSAQNPLKDTAAPASSCTVH